MSDVTNASSLPVHFDPALVEEAVLRAMAGHAEERAFRRARDRLYVLPEGETRERAFAELHAQWFARLGLGEPVYAALGEFPLLADACVQCVVARALTRCDEGADLLVDDRAGETARRTAVIRLCATAFEAPQALLATLRAELQHVADMVDPAFGYDPELPQVDGGPSSAQLLRDRYRALWNASVAGRLMRRGLLTDELVAEARRAFAAAFPMLGGEGEEAFERFFRLDRPTHAALLAFAIAPRPHGEAASLIEGGRCPLCRFPTYVPEPEPERLPADIVERIAADFPTWQPRRGLCRQCADLYRARALSAAALATLPGDAGRAG